MLERSSHAALAAMVEAIELPPVFAEAAGGAWTLSVRGRARALDGRRAEAEADLRTAVEIYGRLGFGPAHDPARSALALLLSGEDRALALELVEEEVELARDSGLARPQGVALRAGGLLRGGRQGLELLSESVAALETTPARYEHARSLVELGAALRRGGRRSDAREPLAAGMEMAFACGAERLVGRAREELVATGARPRRFARSGFAGLTASERRVVRLAAEGRSNPEIAQVLYLSIKTVETHLSHAYAKLDLSGPGSRGRLAAFVS
jgi:DNA-binding CsgD family transcriptional regulator